MSKNYAGGINENLVGEGDRAEANQKDYYDKSSHYDTVWGEDNIHLGYYPHLAGPLGGDNLTILNNKQAADALTKRMIDLGRINHKTTLLDLGCGKGQACKLIAQATGAKCVGVDLGHVNIVRANEVAAQMPELNMEFYEGSFTDIPKEAKNRKYSVVFAQVAFCHVHNELPQIMEHCKEILAPGGYLLINDYLGCDLPGGASKHTQEHVWKRLHFDYLHGHIAWRHIVESAGFDIQYYENLDAHMALTYDDMENSARQVGFKSADGIDLATNYNNTAAAIRKGEIGMNLALCTLGSIKASKL
jgi:cyclopropane fatty-acyl-phospholipid synthase-like methyltransferase